MNTDKLKELALAATAGPWSVDPLYGFIIDPNAEPIEFFIPNDCSPNADFICEANPATILALIAERDELLAAMNRYLPFLPNSSAKDGGANKYSENLKAADQFREAIAKAVQP